MNMRKFITTMLLSGSLAVAGGCATTGTTGGGSSENGGDGALIQSINVSKDGSNMEIVADKPMTYTYYKVPEQLKAVIDIAQTDPGKNGPVQEVNTGNIKRVEITRHKFGAGFLTRVEVIMAKDAEFTINPDAADKKKLVFSFNQQSQNIESKPADTPPTLPVAETQPQSTSPEKTTAPAPEPVPTPVAEATPAPVTETGGGEKRSAPVEPVAESKPVEPVPQPVEPVAESKPVEPVPQPVEPAKSLDQGSAKVLTGIAPVGEGVEIQVTGGAESYKAFTLTKPDRLVIDLMNTTNAMPTRLVVINSFGISKARVGINQKKVRIVFDADKQKLPAYQVVVTESGLKVIFNGAQTAESGVSEKRASTRSIEDPKLRPETAKTAKHKNGFLENIEFKYEKAESKIVIKVSGECSNNNPVKTQEGLLLTLKNCQVPKKFQRLLDSSSFASAVSSVTPYQVKNKRGFDARILVKLNADAQNNLQRSDDTLTWSFKNPEPLPESTSMGQGAKAQAPVAAAIEEKIEPLADDISFVTKAGDKACQGKYTGKKISLDFSDADIRQVFRLLEDVSHDNFIIPDDVTGKMTIKLVNVPWDQALCEILDSKNLYMGREGNIIRIMSKDKKAKKDKDETEAKKLEEEKLEIETEVIDINYSAPAEIATQLNSIKSDKGKISTDARTNKIIIYDNKARIKQMKELIAKIDIPEKQVMIEARIVEASSSFTRDLGVQWGIHYTDGAAALGFNAVDSGLGGIVTPPPTSGFQKNDSSGGSVGMSFGKLTSNIKLDLRLSAAATSGQIKIISTPKVVTLNNKPAKIAQGQSIPYQTTSAEGTKTEFVEAALTLEVTPHITSDGSVSMKIKATNNTPGNGTPPPINKKEATTELQVKNGETTVIGGIYVDSDTEDNKGVPFLSDIPLIGWLFKSNTKTKSKTELLIFITPKIIG
jgi:type IV pilus assembly protein PilQ